MARFVSRGWHSVQSRESGLHISKRIMRSQTGSQSPRTEPIDGAPRWTMSPSHSPFGRPGIVPDTEEVTGPIPVSPTKGKGLLNCGNAAGAFSKRPTSAQLVAGPVAGLLSPGVPQLSPPRRRSTSRRPEFHYAQLVMSAASQAVPATMAERCDESGMARLSRRGDGGGGA
jgi:hypothetical protein